MAPAGAVGVGGVAEPVGGEVLGLGVGKVGSVGPDPGAAIGLPSMVVLHPATSAVVASRPASSAIPLDRPRCAIRDNRTRYSREFKIVELRLRRW